MKENWLIERILIDKMILDEMGTGKHPIATREAIKKIKNLLIEHKREYRSWLKDKEKERYLYPDNYGEIVAYGGSYDSIWRKVFFPGERWDEEDIQKFIESNWRYAKPSQYDCTGQIFTWSIKVFNVPSGVVAYIQEAMDV